MQSASVFSDRITPSSTDYRAVAHRRRHRDERMWMPPFEDTSRPVAATEVWTRVLPGVASVSSDGHAGHRDVPGRPLPTQRCG